MDNNDGGKEEFNNRSENDIFPKYKLLFGHNGSKFIQL